MIVKIMYSTIISIFKLERNQFEKLLFGLKDIAIFKILEFLINDFHNLLRVNTYWYFRFNEIL